MSSCPTCGSPRHAAPPLWSVVVGTDDTADTIATCDPKSAAEAAVALHPSHDPYSDAVVTVTAESGDVTRWRVLVEPTYRAWPLDRPPNIAASDAFFGIFGLYREPPEK